MRKRKIITKEEASKRIQLMYLYCFSLEESFKLIHKVENQVWKNYSCFKTQIGNMGGIQQGINDVQENERVIKEVAEN